MSRKNSGRQKVAMTKMTKESNLQVTFSKRRAGLFKKASELCTLTGAEVAILVFSPGKKAFSFGHPGVAPVIDRFLCENNNNAPQTSSPTQNFIEAYRNENVRDLNIRLTQVVHQLETEKKRGEELARMRKASQGHKWWEAPIEELTWHQLEQLKVALEGLKQKVSRQKGNLLLQASYLPLPPPPPPPPQPVPLPLPHYNASSSAIINGCLSQPFNLNVPYLEHNFSGVTDANMYDTGCSREYYIDY